MYHHLVGTLTAAEPTALIVEANGVGYGLHVPLSTSEQLREQVGQSVRVLTHLYVREDRLDLFGFVTEGERALFRLLLTVGRVGPQVALNVLSGSSVAEIRQAVVKEDDRFLTRLKGIGKKTAKRIILELKGKIDRIPVDDQPVGTTTGLDQDADAVRALEQLGFPAAVARKVVEKARGELGGDAPVEAVIRRSLQSL